MIHSEIIDIAKKYNAIPYEKYIPNFILDLSFRFDNEFDNFLMEVNKKFNIKLNKKEEHYMGVIVNYYTIKIDDQKINVRTTIGLNVYIGEME